MTCVVRCWTPMLLSPRRAPELVGSRIRQAIYGPNIPRVRNAHGYASTHQHCATDSQCVAY
ncbi:hypothetical protein X961_5691 [Burkholderia pseudomallei MSHR5613]|nr:hypothetical protein X961_5691 [Burkholderia pseudomallei MSHR5613]